MSKLDDLTALALDQHKDDLVLNLRRAVESQFDSWNNVLMPKLKDRDIACYPFFSRLMKEAGYENATADLIRSYFSKIRARRGIPAKPVRAPKGVTPTVTPTRPAREFRADPVVRVQATDRPVALAVSSPPVAVPGVEPVEVTDWRSELIRLERETASSPWTGADQWMWNYFEAVARSMGRTLPKDFMSVEKSVGDPIKIDCLDKLLAKRL